MLFTRLSRISRARLLLLLPIVAAFGCGSVTHFSGCFNPSATAIMPASVPAGGLTFTLTVTGSGFQVGTIIIFNGNTLPTGFVSGSQVTATVPASAIASPGSFPVVVRTPGSNSSICQSNALTFTVTN
jgi:hypothetical protein